LPEIVTVPAGLATRVPENAEPLDIDTEAAATVVPAAALSDRDAALGAKVTPVGVGAGGGGGVGAGGGGGGGAGGGAGGGGGGGAGGGGGGGAGGGGGLTGMT
jgi:hypothetical protein